MGHLPVPAKVLFEDFSMDICPYHVIRNFTDIGVYNGLANSDEHGDYIGFLAVDNPDIIPGDFLNDDNKQYLIKETDYDKYNGHIELVKFYY